MRQSGVSNPKGTTLTPSKATSGFRLRLAGPPEFTAACVLPALAGRIQQGLDLQVTLGRPAELLLAGLRAGNFDLLIATVGPEGDDLDVTPLFTEEFVMVAAERSDAGPPPPTDQPMLAFSDEMPLIRSFFNTVFGAPPEASPSVVVPDLRGILALAVAGAGYTVLPRYLCREELASGKLVTLVDPDPCPARTMFLATRPGPGPQIESVSRLLLESAARW